MTLDHKHCPASTVCVHASSRMSSARVGAGSPVSIASIKKAPGQAISNIVDGRRNFRGWGMSVAVRQRLWPAQTAQRRPFAPVPITRTPYKPVPIPAMLPLSSPAQMPCMTHFRRGRRRHEGDQRTPTQPTAVAAHVADLDILRSRRSRLISRVCISRRRLRDGQRTAGSRFPLCRGRSGRGWSLLECLPARSRWASQSVRHTATVGGRRCSAVRRRGCAPGVFAQRAVTSFACGKRSPACSQSAPTGKGSAHAHPFPSPRSRSPSSGGI